MTKETTINEYINKQSFPYRFFSNVTASALSFSETVVHNFAVFFDSVLAPVFGPINAYLPDFMSHPFGKIAHFMRVNLPNVIVPIFGSFLAAGAKYAYNKYNDNPTSFGEFVKDGIINSVAIIGGMMITGLLFAPASAFLCFASSAIIGSGIGYGIDKIGEISKETIIEIDQQVQEQARQNKQSQNSGINR